MAGTTAKVLISRQVATAKFLLARQVASYLPAKEGLLIDSYLSAKEGYLTGSYLSAEEDIGRQACKPPHALPRMPHAVRTPTNGMRTAGSACGPAGQACWPCTPVWPGSRKPLKSRGLRYLGTLIRVPNSTLIRVPGYPYKGTAVPRVPFGTLIRVPFGTLIRVPWPLESRGLREPTGVQSLNACPKGVQALHALQTGVQALHACLARLHAVCTPIVGMHMACSVRGKACSPCMPFQSGVQRLHAIFSGRADRRAAIKPPAIHIAIKPGSDGHI
ncbi:hypothetical protein PCANC_14755 [Puccinia coronata f. sp. avenae]|uniref:Uncharacterized protein n=1 Tax=Puccinia coronata f. sp. avenae TaxID=200324 RepID=A0A2N5SIN7_9BASI|nr:hypothetical protein PCANC_14755 [Puccinia coronata f. sp. avenae]